MVSQFRPTGGEYVFREFTAYKNALAGVWMEDDEHVLRDAEIAASSMGLLLRDAQVQDVVAIQQSSNTLGGALLDVDSSLLGTRAPAWIGGAAFRLT